MERGEEEEWTLEKDEERDGDKRRMEFTDSGWT